MPHSMCLIAGQQGQMMEVERFDLFKHRIGNREFNLAVHPEPEQLTNPDKRRLVVSLYETGCKLATLQAQVGEVSAGVSIVRALAQDTIKSLADEIGSERLSRLLDISLTDHQYLNG
ncbi:hypothetical protein [Pseudomonas baetica]|uniref:hypothetical protein n=1 Tax=Pseudomonas baetica TaxID=674054 RepID=UPI002406739F|nr:hypothetical protein [Pseudomonas baetica]MDF9779086.1 hypothetical protein [Pseudomonas baetica]